MEGVNGRFTRKFYAIIFAIILFSSYFLIIESQASLTWNIQIVDSTGDVGNISSIGLDSNGNPQICYYDKTKGDLKYVKWTSSGWQGQTVDLTGDVGSYLSLALDSMGKPHISYFDQTNGDLKYAYYDGHHGKLKQ